MIVVVVVTVSVRVDGIELDQAVRIGMRKDRFENGGRQSIEIGEDRLRALTLLVGEGRRWQRWQRWWPVNVKHE